MSSRRVHLWLLVPVAVLVSAAVHPQDRRSPRLLRRSPARTAPGGERAYAAGRFALILDGAAVGFLPSVSGGTARAQLATHQLGPANVQKKNITALRYDPLTVQVGMGMSKGFYEWIQQSFRNSHVRKSGEIHAMNFDATSKSVREFHDAYIQEITFPPLDASSKEPAQMTVKLAAATIESHPGTGRRVPGANRSAAGHKQWLCSNFRVEIGDLPCDRVSKVGSFTWRLSVATDQAGSFRVPTLHASRAEVPHLRLTISMADVGPWQDWVQRSIEAGPDDPATGLRGGIAFLAPDSKNELARIDLIGVRPLYLEPLPPQPNQEQLARFVVELSCEDMKFRYVAR